MRVGALKFNKKALLDAPQVEVSLFLALAHSTNEINALLRLVLWSADYSSSTEAIVHGQVTLSYIVLRLLAGKLNEAYNLLNKRYWSSSLSKSYDAGLRADAKEALKSLNRYFGRTNLMREVRDRFSFHYDTDELSRALPLVDEELLAYLQEGGSANNLYYLAEVIAGTAAATATSATSIDRGLRLFTEDILRVTRAFTLVVDAVISEFLRRHPAVAEGGLIEVTLPKLTPTLAIRVPWFTDPADLAQSAA